MTQLPRLTDRQRARLLEIEEELSWKWTLHAGFDITFHDESSPGRGHDVTWWCSDGERLAQGILDVYGSGRYGVGEVDWIHYPEECDCEHCVPDERPASVLNAVGREALGDDR